MGWVQSPGSPAEVYGRGSERLAQLARLEERLIASLVLIVEQVEAALGLPPLPAPPDG